MLIIFDFDGVLISAHWRGLFRAYKAFIEADGKDYREFFKNLEEFKKWWNPDWQKNYEKLKIKNQEECHRIFYEVSNACVRIFPWATETLEELSKKHWLVLLTNRHRENAKILLGGLINYFLMIIGGDSVKNLKPDPEGINLILETIAASRDDALIVGDMAVDIMAGKAAGVKTGAVKWGLGSWKELLSLKPDYKFKKWNDLLKIT